MLYGSFAFDYHRPEVNDHLIKDNLALLSTRQTREGFAVLATSIACGQHKLVTPYDGSYVSPLYLYPTKPGEARTDAPGGRRPNLAPDFIADCERRWGLSSVPDGKGDLKNTFGPEDVFHYMYAVFHSPEYRRRYADFLKRDFPRLPLTSNVKLLRGLCLLGEQLTALHLMREGAVDEARFPLPGFPVAAPRETDRLVERPRYDAEKGRVWINKTQYFDGVAPETWDFHIGGYQVCEKWLKDRKGRLLSSDDIDHYRLVCATLAQTRVLMGEIDSLIEKHGGWPLT